MTQARYAIIPTAAIEDAELTDTQFRILCALGTYVGRSLEAWPSQQALADKARVARETCGRALKRLELKGYVVSRKRFANRPGTHKAYRLVLDRPEEVSEEESEAEIECDPSVTSAPESDARITSGCDAQRSLPDVTPRDHIPIEHTHIEHTQLNNNSPSVDWPLAMWGKYKHPANRGSRKTALAKLGKIPIAERSQVERAIALYREYLDLTSWQNPKMMATWLNNECWRDPIDLEQARKESEKTGFAQRDKQREIDEGIFAAGAKYLSPAG